MTPHRYDRTGERIDDDEADVPPVLRTSAEWCELLRYVARAARQTTDTPPHFRDWLGTQSERADAIGDLARDVAADQEAPAEPDALREHLRTRGAFPLALAALEAARREWEAL